MDVTDTAADWAALRAELDAWVAAGRSATFWWRDDDATAATPALHRLLALAARHAVPLALAVIPRDVQDSLAAALPPSAAILQHGWAHANHAPPDAKKAELGDHRPLADVAADLARGRRRLADRFGPRALPVVTPPWNRIGRDVAAALPALGFHGLSTFGPRPARGGGPLQVNTHVDVIDWHGGRGFVSAATALGAAVAHLRGRRLGQVDADEPTGLLTHHLVHDSKTWEFIDRFLNETRHHPATAWWAADDLFRLTQ